MTHKEVVETFGPRGFQEIGAGHDGKGADVRAAEFRIVIVMMVVGASPDAAGGEGEDAEDSHQTFGETGVREDRLMLLVVINHEKTEHQQSGEETTENPDGEREIQERSREGGCQKKRRGQNAPPTPGGGIHRERFGGQDKIFSGSQDTSSFCKFQAFPVLCRGYSGNEPNDLRPPPTTDCTLQNQQQSGHS
jgi:hypothetical protein